jgi:dethiobiotin synthetase
MKKYFVTAIGTDSGKTVISTILCHALKADYWKPVQAGRPTDTEWVQERISTRCYPETHLLNTPASPHYAAEVDDLTISLDDFELPETSRPLIIEGAGGMLVPLNKKDKVIDLAARFEAPVILVCNLYLGSINHSLLSLEWLKASGLPVAGIIFNGPETPSSEEIIKAHSPWPVLLTVRPEKEWTPEVLRIYSKELLNGLWHTNHPSTLKG